LVHDWIPKIDRKDEVIINREMGCWSLYSQIQKDCREIWMINIRKDLKYWISAPKDIYVIQEKCRIGILTNKNDDQPRIIDLRKESRAKRQEIKSRFYNGLPEYI